MAASYKFHRPLGTLTTRSMDLLEARGLDIELCAKFGLQTASAPDGGDDWIAIPYVRRGKIVNHKYRTLGERKLFCQDKGGAQCWWNHDVITDRSLTGTKLTLTEGELDALSAIQAGYVRTISVPGGAVHHHSDHSDGRYGYLADTLPLMTEIKEIVLASDGDEPGLVLMNDLAIRLGKARCRYVTYPADCKDLNDVLREYGPTGMVQVVEGARWTHVSGVYRMDELPPIPEAKPHYNGIHGLTDHYRLRKGDLCVVTGVPGHGKTSLVNDLACRMVERHGWTTCFASFEQPPQTDHCRALRTWYTRQPAENQSLAQIQAADAWIARNFVFIVPEENDDASLDWLLEKIATAVIRYGTDLVVIDPWNELDHDRPRDQSLTEYVANSIRLLKRFARKFDVHLIVVAHPAKLLKDKDGTVPIPCLYDISDSAAWFNKPDVGVIVHRDKAGAKVRVAKSRYHDRIGKPGTVDLSYNPWTARFEPPVESNDG
jgi:twinkle protein